MAKTGKLTEPMLKKRDWRLVALGTLMRPVAESAAPPTAARYFL